jgi:hypothetical protein
MLEDRIIGKRQTTTLELVTTWVGNLELEVKDIISIVWWLRIRGIR